MLLKLVKWAIPLFVSVLLIQVVSDMLYMRATDGQPAGVDRLDGERHRRLPVVIDRESRSGSIIT
jgi:hypothetical protein